jgi:hypothetical protein
MESIPKAVMLPVPGKLLIYGATPDKSRICHYRKMRDLIILSVHILAGLARLLGPGVFCSVVAESVLVKHQLLILNRSRQQSPDLHTSGRHVAGFCARLIRPARLIRSAIALKPSTLLRLHHTLESLKYRLLVPSLRGAADRNDKEGVSGSHAVLDERRSRKPVARFENLLQPSSHACRARGTNARSGHEEATTDHRSELLPAATALPEPLSHADGCLIFQRLVLPAASSGHRQIALPMNQAAVALVNTPLLAGLVLSLPPTALRHITRLIWAMQSQAESVEISICHRHF